MSRPFALFAALLFLLACGDDDATPDASATPCASAADCDDGLFCNGVEACAPGAASADARGCTEGSAPCPTGACLEAERRCGGGACVDADGDGVEDAACGGLDCDDADGARYPGAPELCDGVDDDCDPETLGDRDADGDGEIDAACCNGERCGSDCDDGDLARRSRQIEVCDAKDNDCDGRVDEETAAVPWYPDGDGDGFGDGAGEPTESCAPVAGASLLGTDCDDGDAAISPVGTERCGGGDEDCDGRTDEGCASEDGGVGDGGPGEDGGTDGGADDAGAGGRDGGSPGDAPIPCGLGMGCLFEGGGGVCFGAYGSSTLCHLRCDDGTVAADAACGAEGALRRCAELPGIPSRTRVCTHPCDPITQEGCLGEDVCDVFGGNDRDDGFAPHVECRPAGAVAEGGSCAGGPALCAAGMTCVLGTCRALCSSVDPSCDTGTCNLYEDAFVGGGRQVGFCEPA